MAEAPPLVLASTSPFRRRMLEAAGLSFEVLSPGVDEAALKGELSSVRAGPGAISEALARAKADAGSRKMPRALVIGADQVLALGNELFDKPADVNIAREQLLRLRGQAHQLHTAAALSLDGRVVWSHVEPATLVMRRFSDKFLEGYLAEMGSRLCQMVGGYEIEGRGIQLLERVDGDYFTVIGLPLLALLAELRNRGVLET